MSNHSFIWSGFLAMTITTVGCGEAALPSEEGEAKPSAPLGAGAPSSTPHPRGEPPNEAAIEQWISLIPDVLTWTSADDLALIDGQSGAVRQIRSTAGLGGTRDLIYDPWQRRAVVFELDGQNGEIASYAVEKTIGGHHMQPRLHEAWVDGDARLLPSPLGIVVFEESYGERWKVLFNDQESTTSVPAPRPASAWITGGAWDFTIHALTYTDVGLLYRRAAKVTWKKIASPDTSGLNVVQVGSPPTARLLHAPARGDALLFDVMGTDLVVRPVKGPNAGPSTIIPLGAAGQRIEHAVAFDGGAVALLLISGDSRVLAIETDTAGAVTHTDVLSLPGQVRQETRFFSHDLATLGRRHALAGTSAGVFSILVKRDAVGVHLSLEPGFNGSSLRGPIATISPKPL